MITPLESEATPVLLAMTNEEIANEAMAMTMMCDMTANGRQQVRMILDAFAGSRERQVEVGAIMLESLLRRTCASMVYATMPYATMQVMQALEPEDKEELQRRADDVVKSMRDFGLPEAFVDDFAANTVPFIMNKYFAVIDSMQVLKKMEFVTSEEEKTNILQRAFEKGEVYAGPISGDAAQNGAVSH